MCKQGGIPIPFPQAHAMLCPINFRPSLNTSSSGDTSVHSHQANNEDAMRKTSGLYVTLNHCKPHLASIKGSFFHFRTGICAPNLHGDTTIVITLLKPFRGWSLFCGIGSWACHAVLASSVNFEILVKCHSKLRLCSELCSREQKNHSPQRFTL